MKNVMGGGMAKGNASRRPKDETKGYALRIDIDLARDLDATCTVLGLRPVAVMERALRKEIDELLGEDDSEIRALIESVLKTRDTYSKELEEA